MIPGDPVAAVRAGRSGSRAGPAGPVPGTRCGVGRNRGRRTASRFPGCVRRRVACGSAGEHAGAGGLWSLRTCVRSSIEVDPLPRGGAPSRYGPGYDRAVKNNGATDANHGAAQRRRVRLPVTAVQPAPARAPGEGMRSMRAMHCLGPPEISAFGPLQSKRERETAQRVRRRNAPPGPRYRQPPGTPLACLFSGPSSSPSSPPHRGRLHSVPEAGAGDSAPFLRVRCNPL
jgi:hypothetical protein